MPRPGFVLDVDRSTPPILFHHGEGFRLEKLPAGRSRGRSTRPSRSTALDDVDGAIRDALAQPARRQRAAARAAAPGHEAHDRVRRHLAAAAADAPARHPPAGDRGRARPGRRGRRRRRPPHRRARAAPAHDRGRAAPRRRRPGVRRLRPAAACLYNHDAEDPDNLVVPRQHRPRRGGRDQQAGRRERPPRLRQHQHRVDGRRPQVAPPPASPATAASATTTTSHTMQHSRSFMDRHKSRAAPLELAHGQGHPRRRRQGLPDRDDHQQRHVRPGRARCRCCQSASGSGPPATGRTFIAMQAGPRSACRVERRRQDLPAGGRPTASPRCSAGEVEPVHETTLQRASTSTSSRSRARPTSSPWACPTSARTTSNSIMNPILVMCLGLGYFFNLYRGRPLVREGGVLIMTPPDAVGVPPGAPPELHRLLRAGAGRHDRPGRDRAALRCCMRYSSPVWATHAAGSAARASRRPATRGRDRPARDVAPLVLGVERAEREIGGRRGHGEPPTRNRKGHSG